MTDKNRKLTKRVATFTWVISIVFFVTFFIALFSIQGISNKINDNPSQYPENLGMIGLGLIAMILMLGIYHLIYIVFSIPTAIFKNKSIKNGRTSVVDIVFSLLLVAISMPGLAYGLIMLINMVELFTYGLGFGFIPYVIAVLLHVGLVALMIVQLIKCWPKKPKAEVAE